MPGLSSTFDCAKVAKRTGESIPRTPTREERNLNFYYLAPETGEMWLRDNFNDRKGMICGFISTM
jgi:hypothetical protein